MIYLLIFYIIPTVLTLIYLTLAYYHVKGIFNHVVRWGFFNDMDRAMFTCAFIPLVNLYTALQWIQDFPILLIMNLLEEVYIWIL